MVLNRKYFLPARQPRRTSGLVATGEIDHPVDFHTRQVCQIVYDNCSRTVVARRIETLEAVFQAAARNFTIRLAEKLAKFCAR